MKRIIFFGKTGVGKSTLATMLYQRRLSAVSNPFEISDSAVGMTTDCIRRSNDKWSIYDTIGLGETPLGTVPHDQAKARILSFLKDLKVPFNYICIVKKKGRLDQLDPVIFNATKEIFEGSTINNIILVITDADEEWVQENIEDIQEVYRDIPVCTVDFPSVHKNPLYEKVYVEERENSLAKFEKFLDELNYPARKADICYYTEAQLKALASKVLDSLATAGLAIGAGIAALGVVFLCSIQ